MREIKFRAWDEKTRKMYKDIQCMPNFIDFIDDKFFHVMQFTGLLDKNGKEIYEGDIVKGVVKEPQLFISDTDENCNTNMGGIVFYDYSGFRLKVIENLCEKERYGMVNYFDFSDFFDKEVIGNIYENPELLS